MSNIDPNVSSNIQPDRDKASSRDRPVSPPKTDRDFASIRREEQERTTYRQKQQSQSSSASRRSPPPPTQKQTQSKSPYDTAQRKPDRQTHGQSSQITSQEEEAQALEEGKEMEEAAKQAAAKAKPLSPFAAHQQMLGKEAAMRSEAARGEMPSELSSSKKVAGASEKGEGRPELAALSQQQSQFSQASTQIDTKVGGNEEAKPSSTIQQIADKIIEKLQVVRTGDKIDTTITLKSPPILEGASITVTSSATAKGQIDLSFGNLSPEGKALIDQNSASLKLALEKNGYTVHDVVSVPKEIEAAPITSEAPSKDGRDQERDRGGGGGGGRGESGGGGRGQQQRNR